MVLKLHVVSGTVKVACHFIHCVPILITVLLKQAQPTASLVSRFGFTKVTRWVVTTCLPSLNHVLTKNVVHAAHVVMLAPVRIVLRLAVHVVPLWVATLRQRMAAISLPKLL